MPYCSLVCNNGNFCSVWDSNPDFWVRFLDEFFYCNTGFTDIMNLFPTIPYHTILYHTMPYQYILWNDLYFTH